MKDMLTNVRACIFGHAVGDALGVPIEFREREKLDADPVVGMRGYGTHKVPAGTWSDDTSMEIAALDSIADGKLDYDNVMRNFVKWAKYDKYTATDETFDIGGTSSSAIYNFCDKRLPAVKCGLDGEFNNGNGSLMRILPFVLYIKYYLNGTIEDNIEIIHQASAITHAHAKSKISCGIYSMVIQELLENPCLESVFTGLEKAKKIYECYPEYYYFGRLLSAQFKNTPRQKIKSSGYVIDTLEAAVWCVLNTDNYADCVLKAVNLGFDTDTTAAVAGGIAGLLYGYDAIPKEWLHTLKRVEFIDGICMRAVAFFEGNKA